MAMRTSLQDGVDALAGAVDYIAETYGADIKAASVGAVPFLKLFGIVAGGWQMARAALAAKRMLDAGEGAPAFLRQRSSPRASMQTTSCHGLQGCVTP